MIIHRNNNNEWFNRGILTGVYDKLKLNTEDLEDNLAMIMLFSHVQVVEVIKALIFSHKLIEFAKILYKKH